MGRMVNKQMAALYELDAKNRALQPWPDWAWWPDAVARYNDWARESERDRLLDKIARLKKRVAELEAE
jgi:hypothetical protein